MWHFIAIHRVTIMWFLAQLQHHLWCTNPTGSDALVCPRSRRVLLPAHAHTHKHTPDSAACHVHLLAVTSLCARARVPPVSFLHSRCCARCVVFIGRLGWHYIKCSSVESVFPEEFHWIPKLQLVGFFVLFSFSYTFLWLKCAFLVLMWLGSELLTCTCRVFAKKRALCASPHAARSYGRRRGKVPSPVALLQCSLTGYSTGRHWSHSRLQWLDMWCLTIWWRCCFKKKEKTLKKKTCALCLVSRQIAKLPDVHLTYCDLNVSAPWNPKSLTWDHHRIMLKNVNVKSEYDLTLMRICINSERLSQQQQQHILHRT